MSFNKKKKDEKYKYWKEIQLKINIALNHHIVDSLHLHHVVYLLNLLDLLDLVVLLLFSDGNKYIFDFEVIKQDMINHKYVTKCEFTVESDTDTDTWCWKLKSTFNFLSIQYWTPIHKVWIDKICKCTVYGYICLFLYLYIFVSICALIFVASCI